MGVNSAPAGVMPASMLYGGAPGNAPPAPAPGLKVELRPKTLEPRPQAPKLVVFSGGTAFNSVAGMQQTLE